MCPCGKVLTSAEMTSVLISSICACVSTREPAPVGRWVCLLPVYPASVARLSLRAAGLPSASEAQMAFDNGLNRQMPGRHLAIDHSGQRCFHFPCSPAGGEYLKPAD